MKWNEIQTYADFFVYVTSNIKCNYQALFKFQRDSWAPMYIFGFEFIILSQPIGKLFTSWYSYLYLAALSNGSKQFLHFAEHPLA